MPLTGIRIEREASILVGHDMLQAVGQVSATLQQLALLDLEIVSGSSICCTIAAMSNLQVRGRASCHMSRGRYLGVVMTASITATLQTVLRPCFGALQDLAVTFVRNAPFSSDVPLVGNMLSAAACSCLKLQSLALSGVSTHRCVNEEALAMTDDISRLSRLTALALHEGQLSSLAPSLTKLTQLQQLSVGLRAGYLSHQLAALPGLHTLQVRIAASW